MVVAYAERLKDDTRNQVEGMALLWGLKIALSLGMKTMEIEGDSMLIVEATKGKMKMWWSLKGIMEDIFSLLNGLQDFSIQHVFREGNATTDSMAVVDLDIEGL